MWFTISTKSSKLNYIKEPLQVSNYNIQVCQSSSSGNWIWLSTVNHYKLQITKHAKAQEVGIDIYLYN